MQTVCKNIEEPPEPMTDSPSELVSETKVVDLYTINGAYVTYNEEDGTSFISVSKNDIVIDAVRAKLVPASQIRGIIKSGKIDELKNFIPPEAFEMFKGEFNKTEATVESQEVRNEHKQAMINSINQLRGSIKNKEIRKAEYEKELHGLKGKNALSVRTNIRKLYFDIRKDKFTLAKIEKDLKHI